MLELSSRSELAYRAFIGPRQQGDFQIMPLKSFFDSTLMRLKRDLHDEGH